MNVEINGNRLEVEVLGPEGAPVLIAHHGAPGLGSRAEPRSSFGRLADRYRVLVFDARGSGDSEGKEPFTHEQWAADVDGLRQWIGADRIIMAGGSYGGFISLEYAVRYPDRVTALVLRDTAGDHSHEAASRATALATTRVQLDVEKFDRINNGQVTSDDDLRDCWREILPLYDFHYDPEVVEQKVASTPYRYRTHNYAFTHNIPNYDLKDRLGDITAPTLITVGRTDWITPVQASETLHRLIPGSELTVFEESGHSPQIEQADEWTARVRAFLAEHVPAGEGTISR
ncbi:alpha/beta fold hydrolase [Nakamurella lactea]|uniref:alpha/beta fold hydrolase n=1 Tax=Nakamurella lactea TaxID=459515 RepID=UPI0003F6BE51|nr:alpha/beta hydrolase [Nakamurella lactea]